MVRLRDLAEQVGVHPSTVSRVLTGDPSARLAPATRARILELAEQSGYRPNRLGRSLKVQRTNILAMLVPDVTNPLFAVMLRAVEDVAASAGFNVILCNTDDRPDRFDRHYRLLAEGHVDGLLIATARRHDRWGISARGDRPLPCVLLNRRRDDDGDAWVVPDDRAGVRVAVAHLASLGHRRLGHLAGSTDISTTSARRDEFVRAVGEHGLPVDYRLIVEAGLTEAPGAAALARLLELPAERRPTAVLAANDLAALGAMKAALAAGLKVPDDLALVGFNDIPLAAFASPSLTTVRIPAYTMGRLAAEILLRRLERNSPTPATEQITLPVELVVRDSTTPRAGQPVPRPQPG